MNIRSLIGALAILGTAGLVAGCGDDDAARPTAEPVWSARSIGADMTGTAPRDVWASSPGDVYLVNGDGALVHCDADSCHVVDSAPAALHSVWGDAQGVLMCGGDDGAVHRFDGEWTTEQAGPTGESDWIHCFAGHDGEDLYALSTGVLYHRGAAGWSKIAGTPAQAQFDMELLPDGSLIVLTYDNSPAIWDGASWTRLPQVPQVFGRGFALAAVWGDAEGNFYVAGGDGGTNGGAAIVRHDGYDWNIVLETTVECGAFGSATKFHDIVGLGDGSGLAVGDCGHAYRIGASAIVGEELPMDASMWEACWTKKGAAIVVGTGVMFVYE